MTFPIISRIRSGQRGETLIAVRSAAILSAGISDETAIAQTEAMSFERSIGSTKNVTKIRAPTGRHDDVKPQNSCAHQLSDTRHSMFHPLS